MRRICYFLVPREISIDHMIALIDQLPHDARIVAIRPETNSLRTAFFVEHESFREVAYGTIAPELLIHWYVGRAPKFVEVY